MKKDFEKESEEDRFNRLSRNLQILLEDQALNVPKICSTLVIRKGDRSTSRARIESHQITLVSRSHFLLPLFSFSQYRRSCRAWS